MVRAKRLIVAAALVAAAFSPPVWGQGTAPGYGALDFEPPAAGTYQLPPLASAPDGEVLTTDHQAVALHQLFGADVTLLSFIYTGCGDVNGCPLAAHVLQRTLRVAKRDPQIANALQVVSLSFDPIRDTPDVLRRYGHWFQREHPNWTFVTTRSETQLELLLDGFGQNRIIETGADGQASGAFAHTLRVFLIDRERRIRNIYSVDFLHPDVIVNDIKTLLAEQSAEPLRSTPTNADSQLTLLLDTPPLGLSPVPIPIENPQTEAKARLGQRLFFDRRLSLNNTLSCAMCHIPAQGFANNELATPVGFEGRTVRRNAPTLYNVGYRKYLFHDGRESTLEQQVWLPLLARNEMANPSIGAVIDKIRAMPDYVGRFEAVFGRGPGMETIGEAFASYQRTLMLGNSAFDQWRFEPRSGALSADEEAGFALFTGAAGCSGCHLVSTDRALFTDDQFHNTGIGWERSMRKVPASHRVQLAPGVFADVASAIIDAASEPTPSDLGRYEITQDPADRWKYLTPSLRNVALTPPYMHDGSVATLEQVVAYYNNGGYPHPQLDRRIKPLGLNALEQRQLVAFLQALTGNRDDLERHLTVAGSAPIGDVSADDPHYAHKGASSD